jgi:hypothetical protein
MPKNFFYNSRSINQNSKTENLSSIKYMDIEQNVNINNLLNRVRIKERSEKKQTFFFLGSLILSLSVLGIFLTLN